jgi:superfamily II DNA or RNA helicase
MSQLDFQDGVFGPTPYPEPLKWQKRAIREFTATDEHFLADATPGAGKTAFAAYLFRHLYGSEWKRIFVITNSRQRRGSSKEGGGWIGDLSDFGIPVMENWAGRESDPTIKDYFGAVMTYHILPGDEQDLKALTQVPSLVVFDEIHHLGDQLTWGHAAKEAFDHPNVQTLGLTGTPFRSDDVEIPFIEYERDGEDLVSKGHVGYTYGDALSEGVLRYVHFPTYDGPIRWHGRDGEKKGHRFEDDISEADANERLRAAIKSKKWTLPQIREADEKLSEIRSTKPDAAGLVVAMGKFHARQICGWMRSELGRDPVLVESDQKRAHDRIERFKNSDSRWIVAIQMVSEGVNIERLRVGVYASNITAPLFLHQVIGRVLRGPDGQSWFWFPADERIMDVVNNIREMRDHVIKSPDSSSGDPSGGDGDEPSLFMPVDAELDYYELIGPLFDEIPNMTRDQLEDVPPEVLRDYIAKRGSVPSGPRGDGASKKPRQVREDELRGEIQSYAARAAAKQFSESFNQGGRERGVAISKMHKQANKRVGIEDTDTAPLDRLKEKKQVLQNIIR